jgi:hypothetical protein
VSVEIRSIDGRRRIPDPLLRSQPDRQIGQIAVTRVTHVTRRAIPGVWMVTYPVTCDMCSDIRAGAPVTTQPSGTVDEMTCVTFVTVNPAACRAGAGAHD